MLLGGVVDRVSNLNVIHRRISPDVGECAHFFLNIALGTAKYSLHTTTMPILIAEYPIKSPIYCLQHFGYIHYSTDVPDHSRMCCPSKVNTSSGRQFQQQAGLSTSDLFSFYKSVLRSIVFCLASQSDSASFLKMNWQPVS